MKRHDGDWLEVGSIDDIPVRGARVVKSPFGCIAVFRTAADEVFAIDDKCPHKGGPLSQGIVHGQSVTCPLHNWVISLATGAAQGADSGQVRTVPVELVGGMVMLRLDAMAGHVRRPNATPAVRPAEA